MQSFVATRCAIVRSIKRSRSPSYENKFRGPSRVPNLTQIRSYARILKQPRENFINFSLQQRRERNAEADALILKIAELRKPDLFYPAKDPKYTLPVPQGKIQTFDYNHLQTIWKKWPPWFDRHQTLLILLRHAHETHYGTKPVVTMCTTGPGFGKTRTLIEWGVQVFQHPCVVAAFLRNSEIDLKVNEDISRQITTAWHQGDAQTKQRAMFLIQLHRALRESTVITVTSLDFISHNILVKQEVTLEEAEIACKHVMVKALLQRFPGEGTPNIPFDDEKPDLSRTNLQNMIDLYLELVAATVPNYSSNDPIVQDDTIFSNLPSLRTLIINIDEVQELLPIKSVCEGKNMAYEIAKNFVYTHKNRIVNMAGLVTGPIIELSNSAAFLLRSSLPLDPFLARDYLSVTCQTICNRSLSNSQDRSSLPKKLSDQLHQVWIAACGVPRTIELLVQKLSEPVYLSRLKAIAHNSQATFSDEEVKGLYAAMQLNSNWQHFKEVLKCGDNAFNRLLIDCLFCISKFPSYKLGQDNKGKELTYEYYEGQGYLIPFQFAEKTRKYTLPFFAYKSLLSEPIPGYASDLSTIKGNFKYDKEFKIILEDAIKAVGWAKPKTVDSPTNPTTVHNGQILERATAVSTWLRYLRATELEKGKIVPLSDVLPWNLPTEDCLKGVVKLEESIGFSYNKQKKTFSKLPSFENGMKFIADNKLIVINKSGSSFADVLIPLCNAQGRTTKILCIQCHNVQSSSSKIKPCSLFAEASRIVSASPKCIYAVLSPNLIITSPMSHRTEDREKKTAFKKWEDENRIFLSNGDNWLSDWFLKAFHDKFWLPGDN